MPEEFSSQKQDDIVCPMAEIHVLTESDGQICGWYVGELVGIAQLVTDVTGGIRDGHHLRDLQLVGQCHVEAVEKESHNDQVELVALVLIQISVERVVCHTDQFGRNLGEWSEDSKKKNDSIVIVRLGNVGDKGSELHEVFLFKSNLDIGDVLVPGLGLENRQNCHIVTALSQNLSHWQLDDQMWWTQANEQPQDISPVGCRGQSQK